MPPRRKGSKKRGPNSRGASRGSDGFKRHGPPKATGKAKYKPTTSKRRNLDYAHFEREKATPEYMRRLFTQHGFAVNETELEKFWRYYLLLRKRNAAWDLTRIMGIEATVLKHFVDSALVVEMVDLPGPVLDIGSGPGFPGAPIAIRKPALPVILAESRAKRVQFLEELVKELPLPNVTLHARSVRLDSDLRAGSVVTRALEVIPATLKRVESILQPDGFAVFCKGPNCGQEIADAQQAFKGVYKMSDDIKYHLPGTKQQRRLVVFQRRAP